MRRAINYFFLILGLVYMISGLLLLFNVYNRETYEIFFGIELSKTAYIAYKVLLGALFLVVAIIDQQRRGKT